jgi:hypothetical protein
MKYLLTAVLIVAGLAGRAEAQLPPRGNISLYADGARAYTAYCAIPWGFSVANAEMWVWCLPGENGLWGVECAVSYPSNVISDRITYNGGLAVRLGSLLEGLSASFGTCQVDWCWIAHQTLYVTSLEQTSLEVVPHPASGVFQFFTCGAGNPAEPCLKGTSLALNFPALPCLMPETAIGAAGSTWGAVKTLFDVR